MKGYIKFEFELNGELKHLELDYENLRECDIDTRDDGYTIYNLIDSAIECEIDADEIVDEELKNLNVIEYELYEEWSEQVDVDDFVEKRESVHIW